MATRLLLQQHVQLTVKKSSNHPVIAFCGKSTRHGEFPTQWAINVESVFHGYDVLMLMPWITSHCDLKRFLFMSIYFFWFLISFLKQLYPLDSYSFKWLICVTMWRESFIIERKHVHVLRLLSDFCSLRFGCYKGLLPFSTDAMSVRLRKESIYSILSFRFLNCFCSRSGIFWVEYFIFKKSVLGNERIYE